MALIAWAVPVGDVLEAFESFDPSWLPVLLGSYALTFLCRAARLRALGLPLRLADLVSVAAVHQFMNRVLPARTGELTFPILVRRLCGTSLVEGLTLLALIHFLDATVIVAAFLASLLALPQVRETVGVTGTVLLVVCLVVPVVLYLGGPQVARRAARQLAAWLRAPRPRWAAALERTAETLAAIQAVSRRAFLSVTFWTLMLWFTTFTSFWTAMGAIGVPVGPAAAVVGSTAAIVASVLPIGGIGSFGTLEGGWAAGFVLVGVAPPQAVASALVLSGATFAATMVMAGLGWLHLAGRRQKGSAVAGAAQLQGAGGQKKGP